MVQPVDPSEWISQAEAAEIRGVTRQAISQLVQKGRFRKLEIGGRILVLREDVVNYQPEKGGRPSEASGREDA